MVASQAVTARSADALPVRQAARQPVPKDTVQPQQMELLRDPLSGRVAVKRTDPNTGKTRCIPPEKMLEVLQSIRRAIGLLLDRMG
jgi:hypothetical protein